MTKPTKWLYTQQWHRSAWAFTHADQSSLSAWRMLGSLATHQVPRLIWVFTGRTATLLVSSCRGSSTVLTLSICTDFSCIPDKFFRDFHIPKGRVSKKKESIIVVWCELKIPLLGITVQRHLASLMMPNSYPRDGIFSPHLTTIKDSYSLDQSRGSAVAQW